MSSLQELDNKLLKAKIQLFDRSVFISSICAGLRHRWDKTIPTAATNGLEVIYNPDFFDSLSFEEQVFVVAHETWHVAYNHFLRKGDRDDIRWNMAGDHVINLRLKKENYTVPEGALCDPHFDNMMTEEVYEHMPPGLPGPSIFMGGDIIYELPDGMNPQEYAATVQETIVRAKLESEKAEKHIGEIPGEISKMIDRLLNPILPWPTLLNRFLQDFAKDDYSWNRPNKRFHPEFYLPNQYSETIKHIVIAIDTSGSISVDEFREMLTEIQSIKDTFHPEKMTVIQCDARIQQIIDLEEFDHILDMELKGGGGTRIDPVMEYCRKEEPTCLIYFSDLHFHLPGNGPPLSPIIWVCTSNHKPMPANWGDTIYTNP